jgi:uncharacterized protein
MYLKRDIERLLVEVLAAMPVVVVTGPRQAGKSTLLQHHPDLGNRVYYTLDDIAVRTMALREPDRLLSGNQPITIDEAQRAPELMMAIKRRVDQDRCPGQFLLSGSSNFLLLRNLADNLAGRAIYLGLGPMSWRELSQIQGEPVIKRLFRTGSASEVLNALDVQANPEPVDWLSGGFPPVAVSPRPARPHIWFAGYRQTYLERDLRDLSQVADLGLFDQFVQMMALRSAQVLNLRDIARDCGSNAPTVSRWLRLLETGFMGQRLPPYFSNRLKRLVKAPKWYMADSGLMGYLVGASPESVTSGPLRGALFETYIFQNLSAIMSAWLPDARLLHYRSHTGHEVDFVIETPGGLLAIEAKAGADVDARDVKGLAAIVEAESRCIAGIVVYNGSAIRQLGPRLWAIPAGALVR